ncbi:L-lactate dehydrogenase complex protein LldG [Streptomyces achromogenes]|uniref:L-lactate dehydrogenase complex protein LldG n=1 Tax=Streptomyces achromogenes TaxID=67255 RepID=A0ABU0QBJ6_STRAH|nr:LUD domain-containing protein [Streptomyces achromogenes]MDQ0688041.1 L-lactate dehydrogenase complex protein LldG [Streptomyces achromogenes]MDQ0835236.1 L-lactate dehydrogenase complex protein LldG [Streptomyces achromogenes]
MSSREQILGRVRRALADVPRDGAPDGPDGPKKSDGPNRSDGSHGPGQVAGYEEAVAREYLREHGERSAAQTAELLAENLADYRALVHRCTEDELPSLIGRLFADHGTRTVLAPAGLDPAWLSATDVERVEDRAESTAHELDGVDSVVTACAVAIAETGTIVLDGGPDQGRRRITLVPDHHVCVVRVPGQVVSSVPQALERLDPARPLTWISGPSATSDIELDRVEGVHGPRTLEVVLVD